MLGPHFQFDLIKLARNGRPTFLRVLYLATLLIALTIMYRSYGESLRRDDVARRAQLFANVLVLLQHVFSLLFLPVYLASAIAEEIENGTLELTFLSFITDREIVLGKYSARCCQVGVIVLGGFPLVIFMHVWGNVDIAFLLFHSVISLLMLIMGGAICIWISAHSETSFQAITRSYSWVALLGFVGIVAAFGFSLFTTIILARTGSNAVNSIYWYSGALAVLVPTALVITWYLLRDATHRMIKVRKKHSRRPKKVTAAFSLTDKRRGFSGIHPLALPIRGSALFWKECLKDGSSWSLTFSWLGWGLIAIFIPVFLYLNISFIVSDIGRTEWASTAASFTYTAYFLCVAAYILVVIFQTTLSVAGEREQDTLVFLQLIPESSRAILFYKWLGPIWRNWPILAIGYLSVLMGLGFRLYSIKTALVMCLIPWPFLLMLSFVALCLSVLCRRVLFANVVLIGFLLVLFIGHMAAANQIGLVFSYYAAILFETRPWYLSLVIAGKPWETNDFPWADALAMALGHQSLFLVTGMACGFLAFRQFGKRLIF